MSHEALIDKAARWIRQGEALMIGAGAGMGVDSGLPDFRGDEGFWKAYPPFKKKGFSFIDMANPRWFDDDPAQAWGFYGHRLQLYRDTEPHAGFAILLKWAQAMKYGGFVFTSNVDGAFQKAGFANDQVLECHGSLHHLQCVRECCPDVWSAEGVEVAIDPEEFVALGDLPGCRHCDALARPNVLMFGDYYWTHGRTYAQQGRYQAWLEKVRDRKLVVVELGAGKAIPTVRSACAGRRAPLIRINPRECGVPEGQVGLPLGALEALTAIDALVS